MDGCGVQGAMLHKGAAEDCSVVPLTLDCVSMRWLRRLPAGLLVRPQCTRTVAAAGEAVGATREPRTRILFAGFTPPTVNSLKSLLFSLETDQIVASGRSRCPHIQDAPRPEAYASCAPSCSPRESPLLPPTLTLWIRSSVGPGGGRKIDFSPFAREALKTLRKGHGCHRSAQPARERTEIRVKCHAGTLLGGLCSVHTQTNNTCTTCFSGAQDRAPGSKCIKDVGPRGSELGSEPDTLSIKSAMRLESARRPASMDGNARLF